jgi:hypothetical protein
MSLYTIEEFLGIVAFLIVSALVLGFFDRPMKQARMQAASSRIKAPPAEPAPAECSQFDSALEGVLDAYDHAHDASEGTDRGEVRFRAVARMRLKPLLDDFIKTADAHGHHAAYETHVEEGKMTYRLQVRRKDHPAGQPEPYLCLSHGMEDDVSLLYGGVVPGPSDHNLHDAEIGWRDVSWRRVDDELLGFARRLFRTFDD